MNDTALSQSEREALAKLQVILAERNLEHVAPLTDDELQLIRHMIDVYKSFAVFGKMAGAFRNIVLWLGVMFAAWYALKDWLVQAARGGGQ